MLDFCPVPIAFMQILIGVSRTRQGNINQVPEMARRTGGHGLRVQQKSETATQRNLRMDFANQGIPGFDECRTAETPLGVWKTRYVLNRGALATTSGLPRDSDSVIIVGS